MSFIKRNIWTIGFIVILAGAFLAMWASSDSTKLPSPNGTAQENVNFTITENDNVKGAQNAKVTIVEWSDFQCPACRSYAPVLDQLVTLYPNDVRLVYKHFPLRSIHFRAQDAAEASEAAALQGKFWEMATRLFADQDIWSRGRGTEQFENYAKDLGLDLAKFKQDISSETVKNAVDEDYSAGLELGVNSTPTLYVNGKKIANPGSLEEFQSIVEAEIKNN